jgi:hypothetical protein
MSSIACSSPRQVAAGPGGSTMVETEKRTIKYLNMKHFLAYPSPAVYAINKARHERELRERFARFPGALSTRPVSAGSNTKGGNLRKGAQ